MIIIMTVLGHVHVHVHVICRYFVSSWIVVGFCRHFNPGEGPPQYARSRRRRVRDARRRDPGPETRRDAGRDARDGPKTARKTRAGPPDADPKTRQDFARPPGEIPRRRDRARRRFRDGGETAAKIPRPRDAEFETGQDSGRDAEIFPRRPRRRDAETRVRDAETRVRDRETAGPRPRDAAFETPAETPRDARGRDRDGLRQRGPLWASGGAWRRAAVLRHCQTTCAAELHSVAQRLARSGQPMLHPSAGCAAARA